MRRVILAQTLAAGLLFAVLAALFTWPQLPNAASSVVDSGDPLETIWTVNWIASRFPFDLGSLYQAPIFSGFPLPLAYDDTNIAPGFCAWLLISLTHDPLLSYNLIMVASSIANALAVFLLARYLTGSAVGGLVAGTAVAFSTYASAHVSHMNLLSFYPLPLALLALHIWLDKLADPSWRSRILPPLLFAAATIWQALCCFYYVAYLAVAAAVVLAWRVLAVRGWGRAELRLFALQGVAALLLTGAALFVISAPYRETSSTFGFVRTEQEREQGAAQPSDYLSVSPRNRLYNAVLPQAWPEPLFPGFVLLALAAGGMALAWRNRRATNPRWLGCYLWVGLVGLVLSFGPTLVIGDSEFPLPYRLLDLAPGADALRGPARLATLLLLGLGVVGGWAAARLLGRAPRRWPVAPLALLLAVAMCAEQISIPQPSVNVTAEGVPQAYRWLADAPRGTLVEFPISPGLPDATVESRREYFQTVHNQPLVNGHASFIPPGYSEIAVALDGGILEKGGDRLSLTPDDVGILQSLGVRYVMFDRTLLVYKKADWQSIQDSIASFPELQLAAHFDDDWLYSIYTLQPLAASDRLSLSYNAAEVTAGSTFSLTVNLDNGYKYPLLARMQPQMRFAVDWLDDAGRVAASDTLSLHTSLTAAPGPNPIIGALKAPDQPGSYTLRLTPIAPAPTFRLLPGPPIAVQ